MQKNKEKDVKRYFFEMLTLDHDRRKGFLRPEISKTSVPAIFDYTWYHGLPLHFDKVVVKRDIDRKIFVMVSIHIAIQTFNFKAKHLN